MRLRRRAVYQLWQLLADADDCCDLAEVNRPEEEEEKESGENDGSKEHPSSPIIPTGPTVVLVSILINATVKSYQPYTTRYVGRTNSSHVVVVIVNELPW